MTSEHSKPLLGAVDIFLETPTKENQEQLLLAADEYREQWIVAQASLAASVKKAANDRTPSTTYDRRLEVEMVIDGIPVKLALQQRTSASVDHPWWTLSWRTKYSSGGSNRRFYLTKNGCWTIPSMTALSMMEKMEALGGLNEQYFDHRRRPDFETLVSSEMLPEQRKEALSKVTGPDEDWGDDPFFVITYDPDANWKKVMIVDSDTEIATFRSITEDPDYMPKKVLRPGERWWLDNSMMDANVQQLKEFYSQLRKYIENNKAPAKTECNT